jgi:hypothetical protein
MMLRVLEMVCTSALTELHRLLQTRQLLVSLFKAKGLLIDDHGEFLGLPQQVLFPLEGCLSLHLHGMQILAQPV